MDSQTSAAVNQFANWNQAWQSMRTDIDCQICHCYDNATGALDDIVEECAKQVRHWFDSQPLDPATRVEFERVKG